MRIDGHTELIAHLGHPTHSFRAPLIYNPYFASAGINAIVVPMDCRAEHFAQVLRGVFALGNVRGALITMPHKIGVVPLLGEATARVRVAGACNAVKRDADGRLVGDMFDGEGFVRGLQTRGFRLAGVRALVVGSGGVGSAICASLAGAGVASLSIHDRDAEATRRLASRLRTHFPWVDVHAGGADPSGMDLVVNATPLGMKAGDPLPLDVSRLAASTFVGEVVLSSEDTPLVAAARARGCEVQVGTDMLFEMIPAYLEFFGYPTTTAAHLRSVARHM